MAQPFLKVGMKKIIQINSLVNCDSCDLNGFFCYTPQGADFNTCPLCGDFSYNCGLDWDKYRLLNDEKNGGNVCAECKIIYEVGCRHACNGCCFNGHLVGKWKHIPSDQIYTGMPQFDDMEECAAELNNIEILEWICPNNGLHCTKGSYPKETHPQYYSQCPLSNLNR